MFEAAVRPEATVSVTSDTYSDSNGSNRARGIEMPPALAQAYSEIKPLIYQKIFSIVENHADAEELVEDTFMRAYKAYSDFRGDCSIKTWLYHIATNLSLNRKAYWQRRRKNDTLSFDYEDPTKEGTSKSLVDRVSLETNSPDALQRDIELSEIIQKMSEGLDRLPTKKREILILRNINNHSYEEIAQILGIGVGTVKSRIARARDELYSEVYGYKTDRKKNK